MRGLLAPGGLGRTFLRCSRFCACLLQILLHLVELGCGYLCACLSLCCRVGGCAQLDAQPLDCLAVLRVSFFSCSQRAGCLSLTLACGLFGAASVLQLRLQIRLTLGGLIGGLLCRLLDGSKPLAHLSQLDRLCLCRCLCGG